MAAKRTVSFDDPLSHADETTLLDTLPNRDPLPDAQTLAGSLGSHLQLVLDKLPYRESLVLRLHFGLQGAEPKSFDEIAGIVGLSTERVRQLKSKALQKIKQASWGKNLQRHLQ